VGPLATPFYVVKGRGEFSVTAKKGKSKFTLRRIIRDLLKILTFMTARFRRMLQCNEINETRGRLAGPFLGALGIGALQVFEALPAAFASEVGLAQISTAERRLVSHSIAFIRY
jgi:hypothetical protein